MSARLEQQRDRVASRSVGVVAIVAVLAAASGVVVSTAILRAHGWSATRGSTAPGPLEIGIVEQSPIDDAHRAEDLRRQQREELSRYRFVDETHEVATIPIDRAMRIVAERNR